MGGFVPKRKYDEQTALVKQIVPGKYMFIYENPDHWGVYRADSLPKQPTGYTVVIIDIDYDAPGEHERIDISYQMEGASGPVVDTHGIMALYDNEEEANRTCETMMALLATYKTEIAAPLLKVEMGVAMLVEY